MSKVYIYVCVKKRQREKNIRKKYECDERKMKGERERKRMEIKILQNREIHC